MSHNRFVEVLRTRRSQYHLGKSLPLPSEEVADLIKEAIRQAPSSFNSQSSRAIILFGDESAKLWQITKETLRRIAPEEGFAATEAKIDSFAAGAGTILFYEDQSVVQGLQESFSLYADNFPVWSEQASGMAQLAVWAALAEAGIGASLQHYNPLIDEDVAATWDVPSNWKLRAQMPFGSHEKSFGDKTFMDDEARFKVFA
ncbi:nitroreductase family protein [Consotaella aegiceratis]|uniref:nitroreductase family protein n=1 Tax=Consotaella aegiceratis TaxID=3097961 RepID=UPI002F428CC1